MIPRSYLKMRRDLTLRDQARKKMVVYSTGKYDVDEDGYAEPIVCAWIGDVIIKLKITVS